MKKFLSIIFLSISLVTYSQTQQKIEWESLADSPWPIIRGDAQGTGRSQFVGPTKANIVWTADIPLGILYGPVIGYNDKLYFGTNSINSSNDNYFYSYNPDGTPFWVYNTGHNWPNTDPPIIAKDSTIYFGSNTGYLHKLSYDGQLLWKIKVTEGNGRFYMNIHKNGNLYLTTKNLKVVTPEGEIIIEKEIDKLNSPIAFSPDGKKIFFKTGVINSPDVFSYLICADILCNLLWQIKFDELNLGQPMVDNQGNIYVFGRDSTAAYNSFLYSITDSNTVRWKYKFGGDMSYSAPTIDHEGNIIFHALDGLQEDPNDWVNKIISLNYNGELNWEYLVEPDEYIFDNSSNHGLVCDAEGNIFFGSTAGTYFWALNKYGELLWKIPLNGLEYDSSPAIGSDGTLYLGTQISTFYQEHEDNLIAIRENPNSITDDKLPEKFTLYQNYPNPFNPSTSIRYQVASTEHIVLKVYDILGRDVKTLVNEVQSAGNYEVEFNASNLTSGVYIYKLQAGNFNSVKKLVLVK